MNYYAECSSIVRVRNEASATPAVDDRCIPRSITIYRTPEVYVAEELPNPSAECSVVDNYSTEAVIEGTVHSAVDSSSYSSVDDRYAEEYVYMAASNSREHSSVDNSSDN